MRTPYNERTRLFLEKDIELKEPFNLFDKWFQEVRNDKRFVEPNAMCLATSTKYFYTINNRIFLSYNSFLEMVTLQPDSFF